MRDSIQKILDKYGISMEQLEERQHVRLDSHSFMPLVVEYLGKNEDGNKTFSVSHYYEQNGDSVPDPDMMFIESLDIRKRNGKYEEYLKWFPATFQDIRKYQEVYPVVEGKKYVNLRLKKDLESFVVMWKRNLVAQFYEMGAKLQQEVC